MHECPTSSDPSEDALANAGPRILVVDDLPTIRQIASVLLTKAGFMVDVAENGAEAIDLAAALPYALILMDVNMPDLDGATAAGIIRDGAGPNTLVPIVAMTAEKTPARIQELLESGMSGYLCKPFGRAQLLETVGAWASTPQIA